MLMGTITPHILLKQFVTILFDIQEVARLATEADGLIRSVLGF